MREMMMLMAPKNSNKINECLARLADLRQRADAETDLLSKTELRDLELQWLAVLESYKLVEEAVQFLKGVRAPRSAPEQMLPQIAGGIRSTSSRVEIPPAANGASLPDLLGVLVRAAIEHADGKARAAFYLADAAGAELHHIIGMPDAYARCVNGFAIGEQSLACGLAAATRQPIITPDVSEEPRWKQWLWLAQEFGYRACWSFPVAIASGTVVGSFAMYYTEPREAERCDLDLASVLTRTAAAIILGHVRV
jgi:hypothetical protein